MVVEMTSEEEVVVVAMANHTVEAMEDMEMEVVVALTLVVTVDTVAAVTEEWEVALADTVSLTDFGVFYFSS